MFIDSAKIFVKAGSGGKGSRSFYRDKWTRHGIRDGGDGGKGADIIVHADRHLHTLLDYRYNQHFKGENGGIGASKKRKGSDALAVIIRVPLGTTVRDAKSNCLLRDLKDNGDEVIAAYGGKGGLGNRHGIEVVEPVLGEEKELLLDLKLIADCGVVGFPNAGKSTLISHISNAHPKIGAYPFTTKSPVLGVVYTDERSFVIADIPGLIEGSSHGKGLGDQFLRHIERTNILVHLVDISGFEGRDPLEDYRMINLELKNYSPEVAKKPQIIVANKMDIEGADKNLARFKKVVKKKIYAISALKKEGLEELIEGIGKKL